MIYSSMQGRGNNFQAKVGSKRLILENKELIRRFSYQHSY